MQLPTKAIITLAGTGTRFLPATKAQPKEMLPIIDRPIVQYCVDELVDSGVTDVIMVTRRGGHSIEDHFDDHFELEYQLQEAGKNDRLKSIQDISKAANFIFLRQKAHMPYGNGTPLRVAKELVTDAPFFYLFGDDVTLADTPVCQQLVDVYKENPDAAAIIAVQKMPREVLYRYGVVKLKEGTDNVYENIVEKPEKGEEPSDLVEFGRFLLTPKILPIIEKLETGKDNELWLVDAVNELAKTEKVLVHEIDGQWFTTGDPLNYLKATVEFALSRNDLRDDFVSYIQKRI
ncbi:MAG: UTP--glucose-1-phosphate uridylyltransferase [Patescibacteria group bacterium]